MTSAPPISGRVGCTLGGMAEASHDKSKYLPERFRQLCPFASEFAKAYAQMSKEEGGAVFFHYKNLVPVVGPMAIAHYDEALDEMGLSRTEARRYDRQVSLMMTMAAWYARFVYYGKQIFELTPELAEEFLHTRLPPQMVSSGRPAFRERCPQSHYRDFRDLVAVAYQGD